MRNVSILIAAPLVGCVIDCQAAWVCNWPGVFWETFIEPLPLRPNAPGTYIKQIQRGSPTLTMPTKSLDRFWAGVLNASMLFTLPARGLKEQN